MSWFKNIFKQTNINPRNIWLSVTLGLFLSLPVWAQDGLNGLENFDVNLGRKPLVEIVANIINIFLGVLGVIAVVIIMYGGYLWMTAKGNEEQLEKAKKLLIDGAIGLAIILMAWGIASFIIGRIRDATGGGDGEDPPIVCADGTQPPCTFLSRQFKVASVYPKDRASNVKLCASVQATFNQDIDSSTINSSNIQVWNTNGTPELNDDVRFINPDPTKDKYNTNYNSFSFVHPIEFDRNTKYRALISTGVKSIEGLKPNLSRQKQWLFTTGEESDAVLPVVSEVYPVQGSEEICRNTPIQVVFNEEMLVTSLNLDNIKLFQCLGPEIACQGATLVELTDTKVGSDFKSVTLYPKSALLAKTTFKVTLT
ncbi:MAG: Ig-like domain-containing protein, partial [Patescibacteria group bacterium]